MTDRELLELAAKAAGYDIKPHPNERVIGLCFLIKSQSWNPLTDDGDALRLAVKLGFTVDVRRPVTQVWVCPPADDQPVVILRFDGDALAATRRAIVRAAAETQAPGAGDQS